MRKVTIKEAVQYCTNELGLKACYWANLKTAIEILKHK
jgi:hypothetical protein